LLAPRPNTKLEYHPLSAVLDCLFNIFAVTIHIGGRSSIHNLSARHAEMKRTHLSWTPDCRESEDQNTPNQIILMYYLQKFKSWH